MKRSFHPVSAKPFRYRAIGTLLLVTPLCGVISQLPVAQAQPAQTPPTILNPIGSDQKAAAKAIMSRARQERVLKTLVDLKVQDASLEDVVSRLKAILPKENLSIDVRTKAPVRVSFDLKQARIGDLLTNVAGLAGGRVYVLADGLTIAAKSALNDSQLTEIRFMKGGEWSQSSEAGGSGWSNMGSGNLDLSFIIAQEVIAKGDNPFPDGNVTTTFGKFSPESQEMLQELSMYLNERSPNRSNPVQLNTSSAVIVRSDSKSKTLSIGFPPDASHPGARTKAVTNVIVEGPN